MEFWGAEVKPLTPLTVTPEADILIHISQATLDCKVKIGQPVVLTVTIDKQKFVIGILSQEKFPRISFDLFFEKKFKISHNCTKGSVHFTGYRAPNFEEVEEEVPVNGNAGAAAEVVKAVSKPKAKPAEVKPESDESDDNDDSSSEEEETPKKPERINKKRPNKSASKKPAVAPPATPLRTEERKEEPLSDPRWRFEADRSFTFTRYTSGSRRSARRMIRYGWSRA